MRRLCSTFAFAVLSLTLLPARADAYIWAWLDDLSGPQFAGFLFELQVKCSVKSLAQSLDALDALRQSIDRDAAKYAYGKLHYGARTEPYVTNAALYIVRSRDYVDAVLREAAANARRDAKDRTDVSKEVVLALAWKLRAAEQFAWAERLRRGGTDDPLQAPGTFSLADKVEIRFLPAPPVPISVNFSICDYQQLDRDDHFLRVVAGFAGDIKNDDDAPGRHWMLTTGGSYHKVVAPWLTVGAGAGVATFFPSDAPTFAKLYVQPTIVDIRPGAWVRNASFGSHWRQFVYVRYSTLTFPQGFKAGQFTRTSPAYPRELVHAIGVHFDLSPMLRHRKGAW